MEFFACADKIRRHREESKRATVNIENISRSFRLFSCFRFDDFSHRSTMFRKAHWNAEQFRECAKGVHAWHRIEELVLRSAFGIPNKQAIECTRHLRHHIRKPLRKWVKLSGNNSNGKNLKMFWNEWMTKTNPFNATVEHQNKNFGKSNENSMGKHSFTLAALDVAWNCWYFHWLFFNESLLYIFEHTFHWNSIRFYT